MLITPPCASFEENPNSEREPAMANRTFSRNRASRGAIIWATAAIACSTLAAAPAAANPESAKRVLRSMSDYMARQNNLSADFEVELDIITPKVEKLQFAASGNMLLNRPDRLRVSRTGGYSDIQLLFDGETATIVDRAYNLYGRMKSPGTVDMLIDRLRADHAIEMPGADLILTKSYDELMAGVVDANHIGTGVVDGVQCEHLAFRNSDTDWQIWVRSGDRPLPCKYVITSKTMASGPEYSIRFHNWKFHGAPNRKAFLFKPAAGARSVEFNRLANIGELPPSAPFSVGDRR
jgi:hypothetical protein